MLMSPNARKMMLTLHVTASVGWLGALAVFLAHALVSLNSSSEQTVRAASVAMGLTAWLVIAPLSLVSLATGIVQALATVWGLARHYWVLFKLVLTTAATLVLLLKLGPISDLAEVAATPLTAEPSGLRMSLTLHAVGGVGILLAATVLAIFKPRGLTHWGASPDPRDAAPAVLPAMPQWVKFALLTVEAIAALLLAMLLAGSHGPSAHR